MLKAEYVDHMGSDLTVVNAARVSFSKHHDVLDDSDLRLLRYLARNNHWTPYAHPQATLRMTAPVFIRTQCFKHKVGFTENEVSRRYVDDEPEFFVPGVWRARPTNAKQGSDDYAIEDMTFYGTVESWDTTPEEVYANHLESCLAVYNSMIKSGIAPEQARMVLPQSMLTSWYWTGSLASWARFYRQRSDPHAQLEIQELAKAVDAILRPLYPESWKVLCDPA